MEITKNTINSNEEFNGSNLKIVSQETSVVDCKEEDDFIIKRVKCIGQYLILVLSVLGGALIGPINNVLLCKDNSFLVQVW